MSSKILFLRVEHLSVNLDFPGLNTVHITFDVEFST